MPDYTATITILVSGARDESAAAVSAWEAAQWLPGFQTSEGLITSATVQSVS